MLPTTPPNALDYGNNLDTLRCRVDDGSADVTHPGPPFNSDADNVLSGDKDAAPSHARRSGPQAYLRTLHGCSRSVPRVVLCVFYVLALTTGCAHAGGYHARSPEYAYGFYNASGAHIDSAAFKYTAEGVPHNIDVGVLGSGSRATWSFAPDPIAAKGTVDLANCGRGGA